MQNPCHALEVRIKGVGVREVSDDRPLQVGCVRCDSSVGLELGGLFSLADNSANFEAPFKSKNQSLESDVARDAGDLGGVSNFRSMSLMSHIRE